MQNNHHFFAIVFETNHSAEPTLDVRLLPTSSRHSAVFLGVVALSPRSFVAIPSPSLLLATATKLTFTFQTHRRHFMHLNTGTGWQDGGQGMKGKGVSPVRSVPTFLHFLSLFLVAV